MVVTRAESVILAVLEFIGVIVSGYGLWNQYANNMSYTGMIYCSIWYALGGISHILGLVSIMSESYTEDEVNGDSQVVLQYHYLTGWLSVILGYPLMVNYTWLMLYPTQIWVHAHFLLSIIPVITWIAQSSWGIVRTTQLCTSIAAISHFIVCFMANDIWGWSSAIVMMVNIFALSTPTKYHIWAFNSRELFVIGLVVTSVLMNFSIVELSNPRRLSMLARKKSERFWLTAWFWDLFCG